MSMVWLFMDRIWACFLEIEAAVHQVQAGKGQVHVTGIVEEEEMGGDSASYDVKV